MTNTIGTLNPIRYRIEKSGFSPKRIHNMNNMVAIDKEVHRKISGYYSRLYKQTGLTTRNWLSGQGFDMQYQFGLDILRRLVGDLYGYKKNNK